MLSSSNQPAETDGGPSLVVQSRREGGVLFLTLRGEVDLHNVSQLREELAAGLGDPECKEVVADLGAVPFMDSSGYGAFLSAVQVVNARGGNIHLVLCHPYVNRMLDITRLNRVFLIHKTLDEARATLGVPLQPPA